MLKILIDFTQVPIKKTGVGVYGYNLIRHLYEADKENIYYILAQSDEKSFREIENARFRFIYISSKIFRFLLFRILFEQLVIPIIIIKNKINIVHSLHYSFPLFAFNAKRVVTIHDLTFIKFPQYHKFLKIVFFRFFIYCSYLFCNKIISVSGSTKNDYIEIIPKVKNKIVVIHLGSPDWSEIDFTYSNTNQIKEQYGIKGEYFLFLGAIEPRKNIIKLINAFNRYQNMDNSFSLVIVGRKLWGYLEVQQKIKQLKLESKILIRGDISENDKPFIIKGAKIFLYPSYYEGFGLPLLEAMTLGIPTITSNISSMPEIVDGSALLIDPNEENDIFDAIWLLQNDTEIYEYYRNKGLQQSKKFNWKNVAAKTIAVYTNL